MYVVIDKQAGFEASGSRNRTVLMMDLRRHICKFKFKGHRECAYCVFGLVWMKVFWCLDRIHVKLGF